MLKKIKCKVLWKNVFWEDGLNIRSVDVKVSDNPSIYTIYISFNLNLKLLENSEYTLYTVKTVSNGYFGFEIEFEAKIFYSLLDVKGIGSIKAMEIMKVFTPHHKITRSLNFLQKLKLIDYHGINQVLADRVQNMFIELWEEGVLDD